MLFSSRAIVLLFAVFVYWFQFGVGRGKNGRTEGWGRIRRQDFGKSTNDVLGVRADGARKNGCSNEFLVATFWIGKRFTIVGNQNDERSYVQCSTRRKHGEVFLMADANHQKF